MHSIRSSSIRRPRHGHPSWEEVVTTFVVNRRHHHWVGGFIKLNSKVGFMHLILFMKKSQFSLLSCTLQWHTPMSKTAGAKKYPRGVRRLRHHVLL